MALDIAAAVLLAVGSVACAVAALRRAAHRPARLALAAALACAAAAELADASGDALAIAACVLAAAGAARMVLDQHSDVTRLSWLDAAMGASSTAAVALTLGTPASGAVAAGAVVGTIALSRWRAGTPVLLALAGVAALGAGDAS